MKKLFQQHGEWIRFVILGIIGIAQSIGLLWLNSHFVTRDEYERHCDVQTIIVSNVVAHIQLTPGYVRTLEDHEVRIRTLEVKVK